MATSFQQSGGAGQNAGRIAKVQAKIGQYGDSPNRVAALQARLAQLQGEQFPQKQAAAPAAAGGDPYATVQGRPVPVLAQGHDPRGEQYGLPDQTGVPEGYLRSANGQIIPIWMSGNAGLRNMFAPDPRAAVALQMLQTEEKLRQGWEITQAMAAETNAMMPGVQAAAEGQQAAGYDPAALQAILDRGFIQPPVGEFQPMTRPSWWDPSWSEESLQRMLGAWQPARRPAGQRPQAAPNWGAAVGHGALIPKGWPGGV